MVLIMVIYSIENLNKKRTNLIPIYFNDFFVVSLIIVFIIPIVVSVSSKFPIVSLPSFPLALLA